MTRTGRATEQEDTAEMPKKNQYPLAFDRWHKRDGQQSTMFGDQTRARWGVEWLEPGAKYPRKEYFRTQQARDFRLRDLQREQEVTGAVIGKHSKITFAEWAELYYKNRRGLAKASRDRALTYRTRWFYPFFGDVTLADLEADPTPIQRAIEAWDEVVGEYSDGRPRRRQSRNTQTSLMRELNTILNAAVNARPRRLTVNPAKGIELHPLIGSDSVQRELLTPEEIDRMVAAADDRYKLVFELGIVTGLRISELLGITHDDIVEAPTGFILLTSKQLDEGRAPGGPLRVPLKNGKGEERRPRVTVLDDDTVQLIREYRVRYGTGPDNLLFHSPRSASAPLSKSTMEYQWRTVSRKALGRNTKGAWHNLRRWYGSALAQGGADVKAVADALGNTPRVVEESYLLAWHNGNERNAAIISAARGPRRTPPTGRHLHAV